MTAGRTLNLFVRCRPGAWVDSSRSPLGPTRTCHSNLGQRMGGWPKVRWFILAVRLLGIRMWNLTPCCAGSGSNFGAGLPKLCESCLADRRPISLLEEQQRPSLFFYTTPFLIWDFSTYLACSSGRFRAFYHRLPPFLSNVYLALL
jgi:hypothetical protein